MSYMRTPFRVDAQTTTTTDGGQAPYKVIPIDRREIYSDQPKCGLSLKEVI